jgi:carbamoylphosphate synthase large subunit
MTDPETADAVYIEPLLPEIVEAVRMAREALVTYAPQLVREIKIS